MDSQLHEIKYSDPGKFWAIYEEILREGAAHNGNMFMEYCFRDADDRILPQAGFHGEWNDILDERPERALFLAPRSHAKTTQISTQRALFELGKNPDARIKIFSNKDDRARDIVLAGEQHLEFNKRIRDIFPALRPHKSLGWEKHRCFVHRNVVLKDASIEAYGIFSSATGGRADILICDDIADLQNTMESPAKRGQLLHVVQDDLLNIVDVGGVVWVIGTRWHAEDVYAYLKRKCLASNSQWILWEKPALITLPDGTMVPLWPERFTMDWLRAKREEVGEFSWARQYMLQTISDEEYQFCDPVWNGDGTLEAIPMHWPHFAGVDLASSLSKRGKYCVMFTFARSPDGRRFPRSIIRGKFKFNEMVQMLEDEYNRFHHQLIYVENNSFQRVLEDHLHDTHPEMPVVGFYTGMNKSNPEMGLPSLATEYHKGLWQIQRGIPDIGENSPWRAYRDELLNYPSYETNDVLMANWFAREACRRFEANPDPNFSALDESNVEGRIGPDLTDAELDEWIKV